VAILELLVQVLAQNKAVLAQQGVALNAAKSQVIMLEDSVRHLTARIDSLLATRPDTVIRVAAPESSTYVGLADSIGWVVTIVGFVVAAMIAVEGWRRTAKTARDSQEDRQRYEDALRKTRLVDRIRATLENTRSVSRSTVKKDKTHAINPETMHDLVVEWRRYDRLSDDLGLLEDAALQEEVDAILSHVRLIGEKVIEDERRFRETRDRLGKATSKGLELEPAIEAGIQAQRQRLLDLISGSIPKVETALGHFNAKFPPAAGHEERTTPAGGDG
jgi:hypothetical protein